MNLSSSDEDSDLSLRAITSLDIAFVEARLSEAIRWMAAVMARFVPFSYWFPARATARIVVARLQFYPAVMGRAPRRGEPDLQAIPLFLASTDRNWDPFGDDGRRADDIFDRAGGMKQPPVAAYSKEEWYAHEMARIGVSTLETDGTILPPCHVPKTIATRDDLFLIGAATHWRSLPLNRFVTTACYPLLVFRGQAQWAACVVPACFWNPKAYAGRRRSASSQMKWGLSTARRFADRLPWELPWPPFELTA